MTSAELWNIVIQGLVAFGTLLLGAIAIWGDFIRHRLLGPRLKIKLLDQNGTLTNIASGSPGRYYKIDVSNRRRWSPAINVRVILKNILKPAADGTLTPQVLSGPIQLTWIWLLPQYPTIGPNEICTFGKLIKGENFYLSTYIVPNNFVGHLKPSEKMLIEVQAVADNAESEPLFVEISWDGRWSDDTLQMRQHLVVKEAIRHVC
jgi:hypothetical protein